MTKTKPELLNLAAVEAAARAAHEVNRAYCLALGDDSQLPWDQAPEWQKESARKGVALHVCDSDATPDASHRAWLEEKVATGWKYGPVKDAEKREHPCMVPFEELPREQQAKDHLFRATVHAAWAVWAEAQKDALT